MIQIAPVDFRKVIAVEEIVLDQSSHPPVEGRAPSFVITDIHELEKLIVRDELRMKYLPKQRHVLRETDFDGALR